MAEKLVRFSERLKREVSPDITAPIDPNQPCPCGCGATLRELRGVGINSFEHGPLTELIQSIPKSHMGGLGPGEPR